MWDEDFGKTGRVAIVPNAFLNGYLEGWSYGDDGLGGSLPTSEVQSWWLNMPFGSTLCFEGASSHLQIKLTMDDPLHVKRQDDSTCYLGYVWQYWLAVLQAEHGDSGEYDKGSVVHWQLNGVH